MSAVKQESMFEESKLTGRRRCTELDGSFHSPDSNATIQMNAMEPIARSFVDTYRNGKQIAYHRSMEMNVSVSTDTVTETVCKLSPQMLVS